MPSIELQRGNGRFDGHGWPQASKVLHRECTREYNSATPRAGRPEASLPTRIVERGQLSERHGF
jgi:hypothetical protein